jgi:hypothetical protein
VDVETDALDEPVYLTVEDVLDMYPAIIGASAAEAADHLRSRQALEGALSLSRDTTPQALAELIRPRLVAVE